MGGPAQQNWRRSAPSLTPTCRRARASGWPRTRATERRCSCSGAPSSTSRTTAAPRGHAAAAQTTRASSPRRTRAWVARGVDPVGATLAAASAGDDVQAGSARQRRATSCPSAGASATSRLRTSRARRRARARGRYRRRSARCPRTRASTRSSRTPAPSLVEAQYTQAPSVSLGNANEDTSTSLRAFSVGEQTWTTPTARPTPRRRVSPTPWAPRRTAAAAASWSACIPPHWPRPRAAAQTTASARRISSSRCNHSNHVTNVGQRSQLPTWPQAQRPSRPRCAPCAVRRKP